MAEVRRAKLSPSILAADFAKLGEDVADACKCGIDYLHIDIMDGHFVPNISFGADVMKSLNDYTTVRYDVHMMIEDPDRYLEDFVTDNTEYITVHYEACSDLRSTLAHIHSCGAKAGVSVKPNTSPEVLDEYLEDIDLVLVMSVEPGFGGQKFMPESLDKVRHYRALKEEEGYDYVIEIDGGVDVGNADMIKEAGTDIIVAGSVVFGAGDRADSVRAIKGGKTNEYKG